MYNTVDGTRSISMSLRLQELALPAEQVQVLHGNSANLSAKQPNVLFFLAT